MYVQCFELLSLIHNALSIKSVKVYFINYNVCDIKVCEMVIRLFIIEFLLLLLYGKLYLKLNFINFFNVFLRI